MARQCALWEECMGQEPVVQGRTRVVAETVAEVVNGFVEVISLRTMVSGRGVGGSDQGGEVGLTSFLGWCCSCSSP